MTISPMSLKEVIKSCTPPVLLQWGRRLAGRDIRFAGRPTDWAEALRMSSGYANERILQSVIAATRAVVAGEAAYERDSVLFHERAYVFPVLAGLLRAAALNQGRLEVVDFGGSLGSSYRQCKPFLAGLLGLRWWIVEQPSFVSAGKREFTTDELMFVDSVDQLPDSSIPRVFLTSAVPQYLERPGDAFDAALHCGARHLIVDRIPLTDEANDRLCIQYTPSHIYSASYPCWLLSRERLLGALAPRWDLLSEFPCPEGRRRTDRGLRFDFRGMIFERRR